MLYISHRGNVNGKTDKENHPEYLINAVELGFEVELDVWFVDGVYVLGHDCPQYEIKDEFLNNMSFWCHAKNTEAFEKMLRNGIHCFWHNIDNYTLTSLGVPWVYPGKPLFFGSICVLPEVEYNGDISQCMGICSDEIVKYSP